MSHDTHDDGLVHAHRWATEPPPSIGMLLRPANGDAHTPAAVPAASTPEETHDEGLVHPHGWASAEGSRPAR
jgi:hypothetical protein